MRPRSFGRCRVPDSSTERLAVVDDDQGHSSSVMEPAGITRSADNTFSMTLRVLGVTDAAGARSWIVESLPAANRRGRASGSVSAKSTAVDGAMNAS